MNDAGRGTEGASTGSLPRRRILLGGSILVIGQLVPLLIPLVVASDMPANTRIMMLALLFFGIPELAILAAVVILGKDGYRALKSLLLSMIRRHVVHAAVSRTRHHIGIVLFLIPLLWAWSAPYLSYVFPDLELDVLAYAAAGDAMLVISLIVLGGDFWEKLRSLFMYSGTPKTAT